MAKVEIKKRDGTSTRYFWRDDEDEGRVYKTVYKQVEGSVRKVKTMRFNPVSNRMRRV